MRIAGPATLLFSAVVACADNNLAPVHQLVRANPTSYYAEEGDQQAPDGVPYEYQLPTFLHAIEPDAGYQDSYGWAQGIVRYTGTNGLIRVTVNTNVGSQSSEKQDYQLLPAQASIQHEVNIHMGACGGNIRGDVYGAVWNELPLLGFPQWGKKSDQRSKTASCATPLTSSTRTSTGGGGSGSGGDITCYQLEIDHYWYYPDTGEFEYRYTETFTWCERTSEYEM